MAQSTISARIRARMLVLDYAERDLADRVGVSEVTVRNWLRDAENMKARNLERVAEVLLTTADFLLGRTDDAAITNRTSE